MAKIKRNPLVEGISGAVGEELVCRQMPDGSTVLGKKPHFKDRIFSNGQLTHQSRFQQASAYARLAARTNPIYGEIARRTWKTAYNVALSDWFNPPVIRGIQRQDGRILIDATDNVQVIKVLCDDFGRTRKGVGAGRGDAGHGWGVGICTCDRGKRAGRGMGSGWKCDRAGILTGDICHQT